MLITFVINSNGVIYIVLTTCMLHPYLCVLTTQMYVCFSLLLLSLNEAAGHQIKISVLGRWYLSQTAVTEHVSLCFM